MARMAERVPPWRELATNRMVAALLIGDLYTVIVMKLHLTTALVPTLNVLRDSARGSTLRRRV